MREAFIIITNNPLSKENFKEYDIEFYEEKPMFVLEKVRDHIHMGHKLLTHPLMSSIKPNETPYKTVLISKSKQDVDMQSLEIIENSISTTLKFIKDFDIPNWSEKIQKDFQLIDYDLIKHAIE